MFYIGNIEVTKYCLERTKDSFRDIKPEVCHSTNFASVCTDILKSVRLFTYFFIPYFKFYLVANSQADVTLKLAYAELSMGNFAKADTFFQNAVQQSGGSAQAWLGLGSSKLAYVFNSSNLDAATVEKNLNYAFECFNEAKRLDPDNAETLESKILNTSFNHLKVYYQRIKDSYDVYKDDHSKDLLYMGLAAWLLKSQQLNNAVNSSLYAINEQKNLAVIQINLSIQTAQNLKLKTIQFIDEARSARDTFIREVSNIESKTQWYITDEKEKQKILLAQEAAKKQAEPVRKPQPIAKQEEKKGLNPVVAVILTFALIAVIVRLFQVFFLNY